MSERTAGCPQQHRGRPPQPEDALLARIKTGIAEMPTRRSARVWEDLRPKAPEKGLEPVNHKRVYRVMRAQGLLLRRHCGFLDERRQYGLVAVDTSNLRWCFDEFEFAYGSDATAGRSRRAARCPTSRPTRAGARRTASRPRSIAAETKLSACLAAPRTSAGSTEAKIV